METPADFSLQNLIFGEFDVDNSVRLLVDDQVSSDDDDELLSQALQEIEREIKPGVDQPVVDAGPAVEPSVKPAVPARYPTMTEDEIAGLLSSKDAAGTVKMTNWAVRQLKQWLALWNLPVEFEALDIGELDSVLRRYYAEVRASDGKMYSRSTYSGIRASINRHLRAPPHNRTLNLMSTDFHHYNQVFKATLKKLCVDGLDQTSHHPPISAADLSKLRGSEALSTEHPDTLQKKIWFDISIHFARRGCENINSMKKDAYIFKTDDVGREYVEMKYNEKLKNHQGTENTENMDSKPRMYASGKEENNCPVKSLKFYLSKLNPDNELLFQQPKQKVKPDDEIWYTSRPVGAKTISGFMSKLSTDAKLSKRYTNHCIRATTITLLSHAGVSNRAITRITKHRNEESLKHYERDSSDEQKRQFGDILLQEVIQPKQPQGAETEEYMNLMNMECYLPNRPTLPSSTINETSASEASKRDSHGVYKSVCRPARPATATSSTMYQRQSESRNQSSPDTQQLHNDRGVHRCIHPATATSSSMYRRPGSENTNTCCPYNQQQPLMSSTTLMSNRQYPHFQNPYSFEQCSVTVQNHYHYN